MDENDIWQSTSAKLQLQVLYISFSLVEIKNYYGNASFTVASNFIEDSTDGDVAQWKTLQKSFVRETAQFYRARKNSRGFCPKIQKIVSFSQNKYWL